MKFANFKSAGQPHAHAHTYEVPYTVEVLCEERSIKMFAFVGLSVWK